MPTIFQSANWRNNGRFAVVACIIAFATFATTLAPAGADTGQAGLSQSIVQIDEAVAQSITFQPPVPVVEVQQALNNWWSAHGTNDYFIVENGEYSAEVKIRAERFQRWQGIPVVDGLIGTVSWSHLRDWASEPEQAAASVPAPAATPPSEAGVCGLARTDDIRDRQITRTRNIRSGPSLACEILGSQSPGDTFISSRYVTGDGYRWTHVGSGWVAYATDTGANSILTSPSTTGESSPAPANPVASSSNQCEIEFPTHRFNERADGFFPNDTVVRQYADCAASPRTILAGTEVTIVAELGTQYFVYVDGYGPYQTGLPAWINKSDVTTTSPTPTNTVCEEAEFELPVERPHDGDHAATVTFTARGCYDGITVDQPSAIFVSDPEVAAPWYQFGLITYTGLLTSSTSSGPTQVTLAASWNREVCPGFNVGVLCVDLGYDLHAAVTLDADGNWLAVASINFDGDRYTTPTEHQQPTSIRTL